MKLGRQSLFESPGFAQSPSPNFCISKTSIVEVLVDPESLQEHPKKYLYKKIALNPA
jgi:hypothetical protein